MRSGLAESMTPMNVPDRQPVAVVSGGTSGIGRAFVAVLHAGGYRVFACGRDADRLRRLERDYPGVRGLVCDMADSRAVSGFVAGVLDASPRIDLLVSNAGVLRTLDFTDPGIGAAAPEREIGTNLGGAIQLVASAMPGLLAAAPSRIIVVGSGYGLAPSTAAPVYSSLQGRAARLLQGAAAPAGRVGRGRHRGAATTGRHAGGQPQARRQAVAGRAGATGAAGRVTRPRRGASRIGALAAPAAARGAAVHGAHGRPELGEAGGHGCAGTRSASPASSVSRLHPTRPTITSFRSRRAVKSCASRSPSISTRSKDAGWPCTSIRLP